MNTIPDDVLVHQFCILACLDLKSLALTCKRLNKICRDERLWKDKFCLNFGNFALAASHFEDTSKFDTYYNIYKMTESKEVLVCDFQVRVRENNGDEDERDENDETIKYTLNETYRLLLTMEHLYGLIYSSIICKKFDYYDDNLEFGLRHVRSEDQKDREERDWKRQIELAKKKQERKLKVNQVPTVFKCKSEPKRQDNFGNMGSVEDLCYSLSNKNAVEWFSTKKDLSLYSEKDSVFSYIGQFMSNIKEFVVILSCSNRAKWLGMSFDSSHILSGIKLGTRILKIDPTEFIPFACHLKATKLNVSEI